MEHQNKLERIVTENRLTDTEQAKWRLKLRSLANLTGIESICLDNKELFVEYNPLSLDREFIKAEVVKIGFPTMYRAAINHK